MTSISPLKMQKSLPWEILPSTPEESEFIHNKIDEFNKNQLFFTGKHLELTKNYVIKDDTVIIAGIETCFYLEEVLYVNVLFVDAHYRGQRIGSLLLDKVESEAKAMGGILVHLDTFDFQAKDFYIKKGYEIFGILEDCPKGHNRYYMKKRL